MQHPLAKDAKVVWEILGGSIQTISIEILPAKVIIAP